MQTNKWEYMEIIYLYFIQELFPEAQKNEEASLSNYKRPRIMSIHSIWGHDADRYYNIETPPRKIHETENKQPLIIKILSNYGQNGWEIISVSKMAYNRKAPIKDLFYESSSFSPPGLTIEGYNEIIDVICESNDKSLKETILGDDAYPRDFYYPKYIRSISYLLKRQK